MMFNYNYERILQYAFCTRRFLSSFYYMYIVLMESSFDHRSKAYFDHRGTI
jgi:hypothetical protein